MTEVGTIYGQALYALAQVESLCDPMLEQLRVLDDVFGKEPDFIRLLSSANLSREERCAIVDDSFRGQVLPYLLNFLKILTEKGYMRYFSDCCRSFTESYNRDNGILPVTAVTAVPLSPAQHTRLCEKLAQITGKQIQLTNQQDPSCLGGMRLEYDGKCLDDTVSHRLDAIGNLLRRTIL